MHFEISTKLSGHGRAAAFVCDLEVAYRCRKPDGDAVTVHVPPVDDSASCFVAIPRKIRISSPCLEAEHKVHRRVRVVSKCYDAYTYLYYEGGHFEQVSSVVGAGLFHP